MKKREVISIKNLPTDWNPAFISTLIAIIMYKNFGLSDWCSIASVVLALALWCLAIYGALNEKHVNIIDEIKSKQ